MYQDRRMTHLPEYSVLLAIIQLPLHGPQERTSNSTHFSLWGGSQCADYMLGIPYKSFHLLLTATWGSLMMAISQMRKWLGDGIYSR